MKRLHCDMGIVMGNASVDDFFKTLRFRAAVAGCGKEAVYVEGIKP